MKKYLLSNKEIKEIKLTELQKQILVETLLMVAHLERVKVSPKTRLRFDQSFPEHATYLRYLYIYFYNLSFKGTKIFIRIKDIRTNKVYTHIQYKTLNLPCLNYYHDFL